VAKREHRKADARRLIDRFAEAEQQFLHKHFLAPALRGGTVGVKIAGIVCQFHIAPDDFEGLGIFEPISFNEAILVRPVSLSERRKYWDLFPQVRLVLCLHARRRWFGCSANRGDRRFQIEGLVPVCLASDCQLFDVVVCRFDGQQFWYDEHDMRANPSHAAYLRGAFAELIEPASVEQSGLTAEQRAAYEFCYWRQVNPSQPENSAAGSDAFQDDVLLSPSSDPVLQQLRASLSHGGARLIGYVERQDSLLVSFQLDGQQYNCAIDRDNLTVFSSGICLDGRDRDFDLASLIGVLREARDPRFD